MKTSAFIAFASLWFACVSASAAPFTISADFAEVTDTKTGLVWRRCAEGASPSSTGDCIGNATAVSHEAAFGIAKLAASSTAKAWRMPSVRELASILNSDAVPAIDTAAFPNAPAIYTWTSSPSITDSSKVWIVDFYAGFIFEQSRSDLNTRLRLVRTGP